MIGVLLKRVPKFGFLLGYSYVVGEGDPGYTAATAASILSAPFINPVRMVEKQQVPKKQIPKTNPQNKSPKQNPQKYALSMFTYI
jgi:hypothetical protein